MHYFFPHISAPLISGLGYPSFDSGWLPLISQDRTRSYRTVNHALGAVPSIVDVQVKSLDAPNDGFIFRGYGNGERDDDNNEPYGGVVYVYNDVDVLVIAPKAHNHRYPVGGSAIYTGEAPYWTGPNTQSSHAVQIRVRCWLEGALPVPCYNASDILMRSSSQNQNDTYQELEHGLERYPSLVRVRARLSQARAPQWYTDAQGSSVINFGVEGNWWKTGGLKFGYNDATIRLWTSSRQKFGRLFTATDGWGREMGEMTTGVVDVAVWCDVNAPLSYSAQVDFGPGIPEEQLEVPLPPGTPFLDDMYIQLLVKVNDNPNRGYLFDVVGSAMTNTLNPGLPCAYGGLIVAYSQNMIRMWRPNDDSGASVCIPVNFGQGLNSQAAQEGVLIVRIYAVYGALVEGLLQYPPVFVCSHYSLLYRDKGYEFPPIEIKHNLTSLAECDSACRSYRDCVTFTYDDSSNCGMYNKTDLSLVYDKDGCEIWTLFDRSYEGDEN
ncbi:uncharacterized protein LOC128219434 [Mya arenaria]|uniref:uncharacterized protein LOC128219434 n=1 Tax=Mya arenaria TaxID=6604 RepID=UPI0022E4DF0A|nr:uncharacterized protein LOC128219434 [Mya arenaria]